ncbi:hypothetical protein C8J57DRAFT_1549573, partial [Mycena rebaudengoi]
CSLTLRLNLSDPSFSKSGIVSPSSSCCCTSHRFPTMTAPPDFPFVSLLPRAHADVPSRMSCPRATTEFPRHRIPLRSRSHTKIGRAIAPLRKITAEPPSLKRRQPAPLRVLYVAPHVAVLSTPSIIITARPPPLHWSSHFPQHHSAAAHTPAPVEIRTNV